MDLETGVVTAVVVVARVEGSAEVVEALGRAVTVKTSDTFC